MVIRRVETALGVLVAVWGMVIAIYYLNALGLTAFVGLVVGGTLILQLGIALAAILDGQSVPFAALWLWAGTLLLGITALLGIAIIGVWLLPSVFLALIASVLALLHADTDPHATTHHELPSGHS
jgi:hypothetical protein